MERLVIYDANTFDCAGFYELGNGHEQLIVGERPHPLNAGTADETATIVAVQGSSQIDKRTLIRLPKLTLLVTLSDDTSHIDLAECRARGITVCNLPAATGQAEAEYTMALILSLARRLPKAIDGLRSAAAIPTELTGLDLAGKTITIIGPTHAGRKVAALAKAFGMHVLIVDPIGNQPSIESPEYHLAGLHDGLKSADIISLHTPLVPETHQIINRHSLAAMKPGSLLINTAHGQLVNTIALLHALHTGQLGGAALDVIEHEHLLAGSVEATVQDDGRVEHHIKRDLAEHEALLELPNVILTHRHAANTRESQARIGQGGVAIIKAFLQASPVNIVSS